MAVRGFDTQVLVVGAGAVGAILALELAHHNVASLVVERSTVPSRHPELDYLNGRSVELLRRLGLVTTIRDVGVDPDHPTEVLWTQDLDQPPVSVWRHPSVNQLRGQYAAVNDGSAPTEPYQRVNGELFAQRLRDLIRNHPLIDLREGWTFTDLRQESDRVVAMVYEQQTGARHVLDAPYLAGCDGARSTVRRCLDIPVDQIAPPARHCSVYFRSTDPALTPHGTAYLTITARGPTLASRDGRDTWVGNLPIAADELIAANPTTLLRNLLGGGFDVREILGVTRWEASFATASAYRKGRAFLVGGAAHQFHPVGGHADTSIGDAVDLGWKLAATLSGWGGPLLLRSYEIERRRTALLDMELSSTALETRHRFSRLAAAGASREFLAGVLEQEAHQMDNVGVHFGRRHASSPVIWPEPGQPPDWHWRHITPTTWPGGRAPAVRLADGTQLFDRLGPEFTLVDLTDDARGSHLRSQARQRGIPMTYLPVRDAAVRACWERELVLVRPDQHIAWRGDRPPEDWPAVLDVVCGDKIP